MNFHATKQKLNSVLPCIKSILVMLALFSTSNSIKASDVVLLHFQCEIKDQILMSIVEGRSSRSTGYTDWWDVGDTLDFLILKGKGTHRDVTSLKIESRYQAKNRQESNGEFSWDWIETWSPPISQEKFVIANTHNFQWGADSIILRNPIWNTSIKLTRYYKSDWNGLITSHLLGDDPVYVRAVDCRTRTNNFESVVRELN